MEEPVSKKNILVGFIMIVALLALQVGAVYAAPATQATTITGTVQSVTQSTDTSGKTVFVVTVLDSSGTTQTVQVTPQTAVTLGLVTDNLDGTYTVNSTAVGSTVTIDSSMVYTDPCVLPEGSNQPVGAALTSFFCKGLGLDYTTLETLHTDGFGYGEIAQACFMAEALGGDSTMCSDILMAKQNNDYSSLTLPNGETATNWGQLKKLVLDGYVKSVVNLGGVMSGRADSSNPLPSADAHGNGNANGHGNSGGNGNGNGHKP
jgi:hypothetical protein